MAGASYDEPSLYAAITEYRAEAPETRDSGSLMERPVRGCLIKRY